jgi:N6-adenosine-specific RNA methylase IME4
MNNDYNQNYVNTAERPQNVIADHMPDERFKDYPQLDTLLKLKDDLLRHRNHPALALRKHPRDIKWEEMGQFDVILVDPPWMEYKNRVMEGKSLLQNSSMSMLLPDIFNSIDNDDERLEGWTKEDICTLPIKQISKTPSFLFLWVGSSHLDDGRWLLDNWGFKRCEDVVWLKTNKHKKYHLPANNKTFLQRVKEHCLVGVKGDVKRASDSHIIHANIDTDVIVSEEPDLGNLEKPNEIYDIIERFCLGRRRLQLFSNTKTPRKGWITVSKNMGEPSIDWGQYNKWLAGEITDLKSFEGGDIIGTTPEIEEKRPKSPKKSTPAIVPGITSMRPL